MPGLKIVVGPFASAAPSVPAPEPPAAEIRLRSREVDSAPGICARFDAPEDYPHFIHEDEGHLLFVEGVVYDRSDEHAVPRHVEKERASHRLHQLLTAVWLVAEIERRWEGRVGRPPAETRGGPRLDTPLSQTRESLSRPQGSREFGSLPDHRARGGRSCRD